MNVGEVIVKTLEDIGVETVFGGSGQSDSDLLFPLSRSKKIKTVIIRNEQGASFMACGYAMFSQKLGVCFSTAGPGAFNLFSGLAVALSDSLPVMSITPYSPKLFVGKGDLGETSGLNRTPDSQKMFEATTKKSLVITKPEQTCDMLEELLNVAFEGRPGPVNLHVDYKVLAEEVPNYRPIVLNVEPVVANEEKVVHFAESLANEINSGKKVLALLGYGCIRSGAEKELSELVEKFNIPFITTMDGKGVLPEDHRLSIGTTGISGDPGAKAAWKEADIILALGNSFAKWSTWMFNEEIFKNKLLYRINIDKNEISRFYQADNYLVSDIKPAVKEIVKVLNEKVNSTEKFNPKIDKYNDQIIEYDGDKIHPGILTQKISELLPENSIVLGDAGAHMLWLHAYLKLDKNQIYQNPGSFGPMAAHVNASIGVKSANPDRPVFAICGDGDYQMAGFELMTAIENKIPVIWIIFNNSEFNIIKMFQLLVKKDEVYNHFLNPDYKAYAEACGTLGFTVNKIEEFEPALDDALKSGKPAVINVFVDSEIYPPFVRYNEN